MQKKLREPRLTPPVNQAFKTQLKAKAVELAPHFKPAFLQRAKTVFQFQFEQDDPFYLAIEDDQFAFEPGLFDLPTLTLYLDQHETCWQLLNGSIDSMQAFMDGRYRADGNIVLSQLLLYLFKNDDPTIAYQVQD
jgi:putative sterol carrier protein